MRNTVSKLFSQAGTANAMQFEVQGAGRTSNPSSSTLPWRAPGKSLSDLHFLRSWIESTAETTSAAGRGINWYKVFGLLFVVGVSGGFWVGVGLVLMRFWK
jgi:hypothetical protein